jgi:hypothetical protein
VVELNPKEQTAIAIVAQMDQLFEIDAQARQGALTPEVRLALRLEKSKPLVDEIKSQIEATRAAALPKSLLAKACNYTLTVVIAVLTPWRASQFRTEAARRSDKVSERCGAHETLAPKHESLRREIDNEPLSFSNSASGSLACAAGTALNLDC